jgi:hypothetical protein
MVFRMRYATTVELSHGTARGIDAPSYPSTGANEQRFDRLVGKPGSRNW